MTENKKTLADGQKDIEYTIVAIETHFDEEMKDFLFSLGCYPGEKVTILSNLQKNFIISIKDARYSIDDDLARAIVI